MTQFVDNSRCTRCHRKMPLYLLTGGLCPKCREEVKPKKLYLPLPNTRSFNLPLPRLFGGMFISLS